MIYVSKWISCLISLLYTPNVTVNITTESLTYR